MLRKTFVAGAALLSFTCANSQDSSMALARVPKPIESKTVVETPEPAKPAFLTISGSVDAYYKYDFAKKKANNFTSFTNSHNNFSLGMASVKFEHKTDKLDAVADLGFGPRAKEFSYTDDGITAAIKQLYVSYSPASWVKFTAGTWATHVGYELLDPQLNRNYSMSYLFTNGPFSHTGVKADLTAGKHGFMVGISNPTDYRYVPDGVINKKFFIAQYSFAASDNLKLYLNYVGGKAPDTSMGGQFDAVITAKLSPKFNIGLNGTVSSVKKWTGSKNADGEKWWGAAAYLNLDPVSWFGLTLRSEYFNDDHRLKVFSSATKGGNIFANTLSANFKTGNFIFIPELRVEHASQNIFTGSDGKGKSSSANILFAAVYFF